MATAAQKTTPKEASDSENTENTEKTWYPYITKSQFEKFISRLQSKVPEEIDRDYVRAIIRTPSMIYRFLRGIEAMGLIDRDQAPTDRLNRLVSADTRGQVITEVIQDLYADLLETWQEGNGSMPDSEMLQFFRQRTGMGNDSANKMKMFFKYLLSESTLGDSGSAPAVSSTQEKPASTRRSGRDRQTAQRTGSQASTSSESANDRGFSNSRPLTEAQKAYIDTVQKVVKINIDGDWDDDMIRLAFDRLERLFDRIRR